jgi:endonuclease YncB( thermonuclease family)
MSFKIIYYTILFSILTFANLACALEIEGSAKVVDGDTIHIEGYKLRLAGIDAPEISQKCEYSHASWDCGVSAKNALIDKIGDNIITCGTNKKDRYNRYVATCFLEGEDLNMWLVFNGYALAYTQYSKAYIVAESEAKEAKKGIWSSDFQAPAKYRKDKRKEKY